MILIFPDNHYEEIWWDCLHPHPTPGSKMEQEYQFSSNSRTNFCASSGVWLPMIIASSTEKITGTAGTATSTSPRMGSEQKDLGSRGVSGVAQDLLDFHGWFCRSCPIVSHSQNPNLDDPLLSRSQQSQVSIDWFKGKITGKSHISLENRWFPVDFPFN